MSWGVVSARRILYPERQAIPPPIPSPAYTIHQLTASDGASFDVWLLEAPRPRARLLICHGYSANRNQVLGLAQMLRERGYEALLFELRGHGSRPGPCTFGLRETDDAMTVLRWASRRDSSALPVGVLGWSMGASVACQVTARVPEVRAVVADSLFSHLFPLLQQFVREQYHVPSLPLVWITWWTIQLILRQPLAQVEPATLASQLRQPLFAIQGGQDTRVPPQWGEAYYQRWVGPKTRWFEPDAGHVEMFARNPQAYGEKVAGFFDEVFTPGI